jgi:hypothetical protein
MVRKSIKNNKNGRVSRKNRLLYGGNQKFTITLNLNLENSDEEKKLDPLTLSPEYLDLLIKHLTDLIPTSDDLDLNGKFQNRYVLRYNNNSDYMISLEMMINYISEDNDFTEEKIEEFIALMTEMDAPFTSEDDVTYYITYDFDMERDVKLGKK